jgi:hypothetical protein
LLRTRHFAFPAARGLLRSWLFPLCTAQGLLLARRLTLRDGLRIAPYADTSRPCIVHGLLRAQYFKLRTAHRLLCVRRLHFVPIADCSALLTPCPVLLADCSVLNTWSFAPRPDCSVLDTYHSAPYSDYSEYETWLLFVACGLLRTHHLVPGADRGSLRARHLVLRAGTFWLTLPTFTNEDFHFKEHKVL